MPDLLCVMCKADLNPMSQIADSIVCQGCGHATLVTVFPQDESKCDNRFILGVFNLQFLRRVTLLEKITLVVIGGLVSLVAAWVDQRFNPTPMPHPIMGLVLGIPLLVLVVWKYNSTRSHFDNISYLVGTFGASLVASTLFFVVQSYLNEAGSFDMAALRAWALATITSGKLAAWATGMYFGYRACIKGMCRTIPKFAVGQWLLYVVALGALHRGYLDAGDNAIILSLLSWITLISSSDWFLIEDYLSRPQAQICTSHFCKIAFLNGVIIELGYSCSIHNFFPWWPTIQLTFGVSSLCIIGPYVWLVSVGWLYQHTKPSVSSRVKTGLDLLTWCVMSKPLEMFGCVSVLNAAVIALTVAYVWWNQ